MKDALAKAGLAKPEPARPAQQTEKKPSATQWKEELPEDHRPHVPFEAPARTKVKEPAKKP